jgi:hypothetical protein
VPTDAPLFPLARKYLGAGREWGWQWAWTARPASAAATHLHESVLQRAVMQAVRHAGRQCRQPRTKWSIVNAQGNHPAMLHSPPSLGPFCYTDLGWSPAPTGECMTTNLYPSDRTGLLLIDLYKPVLARADEVIQ